jgi:hypothetical membrane protein
MNNLKSNNTFHRLAAFAGVGGPIIFIFIVIVAGARHDGYSHLSQAVSELGAVDSPVQIWQTLNFFFLGFALAMFTISFHKRFPGSGKLTTGLLLYFSISALIGNGIFPCDPGCTGVTTIGLLHNMTGLTGFIALFAGLLLISRKMKEHDAWSKKATYTQITAFLMFGFLVMWLVFGPAGSVAPNIHGVFQRLMIITFLQWFVVIGFYMLGGVEERARVKSALQY